MKTKLEELSDRIQCIEFPNKDTLALATIVLQLIDEVRRIESNTRRANNTASFALGLAKGGQPD